MVNTVLVSADHERDFHPLASHMTKLRTFTKGEIRDFSAFLIQIMFDQTLSNEMVHLIIYLKTT